MRWTEKQEKEQCRWIEGIAKSLVEKERMRKQLLKLKQEAKEKEARYKRLGMRSRASAYGTSTPTSPNMRRAKSTPPTADPLDPLDPGNNYAFSSEDDESVTREDENGSKQELMLPVEPPGRKGSKGGYKGGRAGRIRERSATRTPCIEQKEGGLHCLKRAIKSAPKRTKSANLRGLDKEGKTHLEVMKKDKEIFGEMVRMRNNPK